MGKRGKKWEGVIEQWEIMGNSGKKLEQSEITFIR